MKRGTAMSLCTTARISTRLSVTSKRRTRQHLPELTPREDNSMAMRPVRDAMGQMQVPHDAYYGASTMRAVLNFPISDQRFPRVFIRAVGLIKQAAASVNR